MFRFVLVVVLVDCVWCCALVELDLCRYFVLVVMYFAALEWLVWLLLHVICLLVWMLL